MIHYMKLDSEPFAKMASGKKKVELRLYDEKRQLIKPKDTIIFSHIINPSRTMKVTVDSILIAQTFNDLFGIIPLVDCGYDRIGNSGENSLNIEKYYSKEDQETYGVVGIRISLDFERPLSSVKVSLSEVESFIKHCIETNASMIELGTDSGYLHIDLDSWQLLNRIDEEDYQKCLNLQDAISFFDKSIDKYIFGLSEELEELMEDRGYDSITEFLGHPFVATKQFSIIGWWQDTRERIVQHFCGIALKSLSAFHYHTVFDD